MSYIGNEPIVSATRTVTEVTATAGQTVFNANGGYTVGYLDVFLNGSQLQNTDFTATNGSSVTLTEAAQVNDVVRLVAWGTFSTSNLVAPNFSGTLTGSAGSSVVLQGSTSGSATILTSAIAGTPTLTLPTTSGTLLTNTSTGYRYVQTLYYTSSGTFSKASYPYLRAIRVRCVGGGGGGGGVAATGAGTRATGGGGGGGGYAESFITDIAGLASSVTLTIGSGGAGGAAGANNGSAGGQTSFGSAVIGNGGGLGGGSAAFNFWITTIAGGGGGGTGDLVILGGTGTSGNPVDNNGGYGGTGGSTVLGRSASPALAWQSSSNGRNGNLYGTGGSGAASGQNSTAKAGGNGAAGIIIVELYA
jgi:hypothetical protein